MGGVTKTTIDKAWCCFVTPPLVREKYGAGGNIIDTTPKGAFICTSLQTVSYIFEDKVASSNSGARFYMNMFRNSNNCLATVQILSYTERIEINMISTFCTCEHLVDNKAVNRNNLFITEWNEDKNATYFVAMR